MSTPVAAPGHIVSESVVAEQDRVLATWQATTLFGRHRLQNVVRRGRWRRPARGVVVLHNGPLSPAQHNWVALLACARGSVLGGLTALRCGGFTGLESDVELPRVVQPLGTKRPAYEGVALHWSDYLDERDVHPLRRRRDIDRHAQPSTRPAGLRPRCRSGLAPSSSPSDNNGWSPLPTSAKRCNVAADVGTAP